MYSGSYPQSIPKPQFIMSMYSKGYTLDQIADVADLSTADVKAVINKKPAMAWLERVEFKM